MEDENTLVPNEVLLNLISCNICNEFIGDQIFQCPSGHTSCITCARKIDFCAVCRTRMPNTGTRTGIRNRALEQLLTSINKIPCIQEGCDTKTSFLEMNDHYFNCKHRTVPCPVLNCKWTGKLDDIEDHAYEKHERYVEAKYQHYRIKNHKSRQLFNKNHALEQHAQNYRNEVQRKEIENKEYKADNLYPKAGRGLM